MQPFKHHRRHPDDCSRDIRWMFCHANARSVGSRPPKQRDPTVGLRWMWRTLYRCLSMWLDVARQMSQHQECICTLQLSRIIADSCAHISCLNGASPNSGHLMHYNLVCVYTFAGINGGRGAGCPCFQRPAGTSSCTASSSRQHRGRRSGCTQGPTPFGSPCMHVRSSQPATSASCAGDSSQQDRCSSCRW